MRYDPEQHHRQSLRLKGYDYAQSGAYFVTICAHDRACRFGEVANGAMKLNASGAICETTWLGLPLHYELLDLDSFVVMPNHVHGIVVLGAATSTPPHPKPIARGAALSEIVRGFKTFSARVINSQLGTEGAAVWQRGYHEHVVRNEHSLLRIRQYIADNPASWPTDPENPLAIRQDPGDTGRV